MSASLQTLLTMALYMAAMIIIGVFFAKFANEGSENFFIGGRKLGPWIAAMSAEASDMSGWLLMGLPGVAYWCGLADATWTAIGLAIGTYLNWLFVSKRLRNYSLKAGNSITIPEFISNRFKEKQKGSSDDRRALHSCLFRRLYCQLFHDLRQAVQSALRD